MSGPAPQQPPPEDPGGRVRPMALFRWGVYVSLGVLATAAAAAVYTARGVLIWALIAMFLAISLDPAVRMLVRWHIRRGLAILVVVLVTLGLVAAFLQSVIPAMADQFPALVAVTDLIPMVGATLGAGDLRHGGAAGHPPVADFGTSSRVLRGLPATGELPDSAADHAPLPACAASPGALPAFRLRAGRWVWVVKRAARRCTRWPGTRCRGAGVAGAR
jgi:hypothetical protein